MEAALIALVPSSLLLGLFVGSVAVYLVMTQQKILALAHVPQHIVTFYNVADRDAGSIIKSYQRAGYRVEPPKRNRLNGLFEITMTLAV